ncbi:MAG TPA: tetratricopeptide repeat protein [Candidatus Eremiobacteraeota bacterium]|nr:tetratricopeptide repeat protein [Candidatus Eremiobacteraeota bacterium]
MYFKLHVSHITPYMTDFFARLEEIYSKAARLLDRGGKNLCSPCRFCCTYFLIHGVSQIEYDYIEMKLNEEGRGDSGKIFKDYIRKKRNLYGKLIYEGCPLYDSDKMGCSIYTFRPYSCRFFGFYSPVPEFLFCPFHRYSITYSVKNFYNIVPLAKEFLELRNSYNIYKSETVKEKVEALYQMGYDLYFQGNKENAEIYLLEALLLDPNHWKSHFQLSQIYYFRGEISRAINSAEFALKKDHHNIDIKIHLSLLYLQENRIKDSSDMILEVLSKEGENKIALGILSYLLYLAGNRESSYIYCQRALSLDPHMPVANTVLKLLSENT